MNRCRVSKRLLIILVFYKFITLFDFCPSERLTIEAGHSVTIYNIEIIQNTTIQGT